MDQSAAPLLLRAWKNICRIFLDYLKKSPSSLFQSVNSIFAGHEFQSRVVNIPHIHALLKVKWDQLSQEEKTNFQWMYLRQCSWCHRIKEVQSHIEKGLFNHTDDVQNIINLAMSIIPHKCNPRCLVMTGPNKFTCRKPNYLLMNNNQVILEKSILIY